MIHKKFYIVLALMLAASLSSPLRGEDKAADKAEALLIRHIKDPDEDRRTQLQDYFVMMARTNEEWQRIIKLAPFLAKEEIDFTKEMVLLYGYDNAKDVRHEDPTLQNGKLCFNLKYEYIPDDALFAAVEIPTLYGAVLKRNAVPCLLTMNSVELMEVPAPPANDAQANELENVVLLKIMGERSAIRDRTTAEILLQRPENDPGRIILEKLLKPGDSSGNGRDAVIRKIGGWTFYRRLNKWTDFNYKANKETKPVEIKAFSKEYAELEKKHADLGAVLALGGRILVVVEGTAYQIEPAKQK